MIQTAIFDRDGVLTYFNVELAQEFYGSILPIDVYELGKRWQMWGMQIGFPTSAAEEEAFFSGFWTGLGQEYELDPGDIARLIDRSYTDFVTAYADAQPMLAALKAQGFAIGVLSNFSLFSLDASLTATGLAPYVDVAHAATIRGAAKPDPAAYQQIAAALGTTPDRCVFIDDEEPCVTGAAQAGMVALHLDRAQGETRWDAHMLADLSDVAGLLEFLRVRGQIAQ